MINRRNEFVYLKRHYLLPFKPLMDWEYKKFGYKKCDKDKGKSKMFNTVYYVRHIERPKGMCDMIYYLNLPFSFFRAIVWPILLAVWLLSMLIEGTIGGNLFLDKQMVILALIFPVMLITALLSNVGNNLYKKNDTNGKLDRIMKSHGWPAWTSLRDNDPRFTPPGSQNSASKPKSAPKPAPKQTQPTQNKPVSTPPVNNTPTNTEDDTITLITANGEAVRFTKIAVIVHYGKYYVILQPLELIEGMDDDEALVFRVSQAADGSESFEVETDDDIIDAVFDEYDRLYDESL